ncbi:MAG TPA: hypothetical protein VGS79_27850 [Puia sp.]|nr:hypothetical protein [Puia sp.]
MNMGRIWIWAGGFLAVCLLAAGLPLTAHAQVPPVHGQTPAAHAQVLPVHTQTLAASAQMPAAHGQTPAAQAQVLPVHTQTLAASAPPLLDRIITLCTRAIPLGQALDSIAARGRFEFSYNSSILPRDSVVKVDLHAQTVRAALDTLLGRSYTYTTQGGYLIILRGPPCPQPPQCSSCPPPPSSPPSSPCLPAPPPVAAPAPIYELSGFIKDKNTAKPVANATVYVKEQLLSVLTDDEGHFRLRLRVRSAYPVLTISKEWYADTDLVVHAGYDQVLQIALAPVGGTVLDPVYISSPVERTWLGRRMLSARQRIQSLNLARFFTSSTSQVSLVPWVGTHGRLSGQVTNTYSLNLIGGYSAGVRDLEVGGVFNVDKKDVHNVQLAGVLNLVGGDVHGFQCAGIINYVVGQVRGVQLAAYSNVCRDTLHGVQLGTFVNRARYMAGVQIGLINFADTSTGVSIGLLSFVKHGGAHQLALSVSPVTGLTAEYRVGSQKLNSIFLLSYNPWSIQRPLFYGYGLGKGFPLGNRWGIYAEVTEQEALGRQLTATGTKDNLAFLGTIERVAPLLTYRIGKTVKFFAGPSLSVYTLEPKKQNDSHTLQLPDQSFYSSLGGGRSNVWFGLTAGISFL